MSALMHYNFNDFIHRIRSNGQKAKVYRHWCLSCKKDRGYGSKCKILREPSCHACRMKEPEVLAKISAKSKGRFVSEDARQKKRNAMYALYDSNPINRRISRNLRSRLNKAIRFQWKSGSAVSNLGCSIEMFKTYLESKFQPGMTWDNYGKNGWHIDHIMPLCRFNLEDMLELRKACHYSNLQPLWAKDNLEKRKQDGTFVR
jgi:hypothetical protein